MADKGLQPGRRVSPAFDRVARAYDLQVRLNPGYHDNLKRAAKAILDRLDAGAEPALLDVGCGSGASTKALALEQLRRGLPVDVLGVDASAGMLEAARAKRWPPGVRFAQARAEELGSRAEIAAQVPVDGVLAAYLLRNVAVDERQVCLRGLYDAVRPGGVLALHDYSVRGNPAAALLWTLICWTVVIPLGWLTTRHTRLYRYLWRSALGNDSVADLAARMRLAGLQDVTVVPALGWQRGILHTIVGTKPDA
ncbi:MAG: class I SAM-dependent methyltransferase [Actinomycetales bacterium]